jgi:hypothetical protein
MRPGSPVLIALASAAPVLSGPQQPSAPGSSITQQMQVQSGLESPWDVRKILADLLKDNQGLQSVLAQLNPQQWYSQKGAPSTYIVQLETAQRQLKDIVTATKMLSAKTEDLPLALDEYFRLEALEVTARSLEGGAQRYSDPATAGKLSELIAHNFNSRERFRDYIRDLATSTGQNCKIADEEAQRCRGMISREPAPSSRRSKKQ